MYKDLNYFLFIYHLPIVASSPTTEEHIKSILKYSKFNIISVNTEYGFPSNLEKYHFQGLIFHHSLFAPGSYFLNSKWLKFIEKYSNHYKVAFFQDEYRFCSERFSFINKYKINTIFTLFVQSEIEKTYVKYTNVNHVHTVLTGYVGEDLKQKTEKYFKNREDRIFDITYRARKLDYYMGAGAQEKTDIAFKMQKFLESTNLKTDIRVNESDRFNGDDWYKFLSESKAVLGVEAGVSIVDVDDRIRLKCSEIISQNPTITFNQIFEIYLKNVDNNIYYRQISPRIFEAAAFKCTQILYEGSYSKILIPMRHYLPLKKDFSNIEEIFLLLKDANFIEKITANAYKDLIESNLYTYSSFVQEIDEHIDNDFWGKSDKIYKINRVKNFRLDFDIFLIKVRQKLIHILKISFSNLQFPGKKFLVSRLSINSNNY